ncbi:unnamed protein product [Aphanomyces euteiches]|uniref:MYND-type domain-containing protein n=1 Tax=Aphanomyces euteiches TaxID=100861 RepID=A0A6G0X198_9STRA|nr:hypothetical protein Ae201684_009497 [Aphanomyces euteiches]
MPSCHFCHADDARCRCGQCRAVYFCNRDCQIKAWPTHRPECIPHTQQQEKPAIGKTPPAKEEMQEHPPYRCQPQSDDTSKKEEMKTETQPATPAKKKKKMKKSKQHVEIATSTADVDSEASSSPEEDKPVQDSEPVKRSPVVDDWLPIENTASKKGKKKKGKNSPDNSSSTKTQKKPRSQSMPAAAKAPPTLKAKSNSLNVKGVSWGSVSAREFARCPGGGSAVPDEGTWALGLGNAVQDVTFGPVDQVEALKEKHEVKPVHVPKKDRVAGERMHRLTERERKEVLMQAEESQHPRDDSEVSNCRRRRRSSSGDCDAHLFASLCLEQANEFALIRSSREAMCGCSCGDLVKKVSKMHVKKLVSWLHERDVDTTAKTKAELLQIAKAIASQEKNCSTEECECARNGVPCHQDTCSGCRDSCHNERYSYDREQVVKYRQALLAKWKASSPVQPMVAVC